MKANFSLPHRLWRALPAAPRRTLLARAAALAAPRPDKAPPRAQGGAIVAGELTRASGLGEMARLTLAGAQSLGVPTWPIDIGDKLPAHDPALPAPPSPEAPPARDAALLVHVNAPWLPVVLARLPRRLAKGRRIVGVWAWELPAMPPSWRVGADLVHEAWAPSPFTAAALETIMPGRVRVVPPPLAADPPAPSRLGRSAFGLPEGARVVLVSFNLASSLERKNPFASVAAFRMAFGDRPDRVLLLKVGNPHHAPDDMEKLRSAAAGSANIRFETRSLPRADAAALMRCCDIVLSLHRSEGLGLVPAEAMLLGLPVVATGWSGNMTFMDAQSAALVRHALVPARDPRAVYAVPGAVWAEPDIADAAGWLRRLADDAALRGRIGAAGAARVRESLSLRPLQDALRAIGAPIPA